MKIEQANKLINKHENEDIPKINSQLEQITNNYINFYKKLNVETNDYNRIVRAIENTRNGGVLNFIAGEYDLGGNDLILTKPINLIGDSWANTIFKNGGIRIESSNVSIKGIYAYCPALDNAFQCNNGAFSNINIEKCKGVARDHSFLFESYYGVVQNVVVKDCLSEGSIHGFISKANTVTFKNCKAINHSGGFGFGVISDNIIGENNIANAIFNIVEDCEAVGCSSGFRSYCRDKWNTSAKPRNFFNILSNFTANGCLYPISIGEDEIPTDYKSIYQIEYLMINGVRDINPLQNDYTIKLAKTYRCNVGSCITQNGVLETSNAVDNIIGNVIAQNKAHPHTNVINLTSTTNVLNVNINNVFEVYLNANTQTTDKIIIKGTPKNGNIITVLVRGAGVNTYGGFDTTNIVCDNTQTNILTSGLIFNKAQVIQFMYAKGLGKWLCISASQLINLA